MLRKSKLSKALLLSPKNDCTEFKFILIYVKSQVHLLEQFICIRKWFPPFHHWEGTHGPVCCISKCSQRTVLNTRTRVCLHHRARAMRGELCSCVTGGNTAEHSVRWRNTRHCCWPLQSVNLGMDKHVRGWKVTLGSDLRTDWARSCLWIFLPLICQQRSALASSSSLLSLHQPFMAKRLGKPSRLARLFYFPETFCCSGCSVLGFLLWEGGRWLHRQVRSVAVPARPSCGRRQGRKMKD